jgi:DNA-binding Lrp family transcriptional regulator
MFDYFNKFYAWIDDNPEQVDCTSIAIYFALLSTANRLQWKDKFTIVLSDIQEMCGIGSRTTVLKGLTKLEENGFIKTVSHSTNQYKNRIICLPLNERHVKGTRKAPEKHLVGTRTHHKTIKTIKDYIDYIDIKAYFKNEELKTTFIDFIQMRIEKKKAPTERALDLIVKDLTEFSNKNAKQAIEILNTSIKNGWTDVYKPKTTTTKQPYQPPTEQPRSSQNNINQLNQQ